MGDGHGQAFGPVGVERDPLRALANAKRARMSGSVGETLRPRASGHHKGRGPPGEAFLLPMPSTSTDATARP